MQHLHLDRFLVKKSLSHFKYFCSVTWRNEKLLVNCVENFDLTVLYNEAFYYFKGIRERDLFLENPERFILNSNFPSNSDLPVRIPLHVAAEIAHQDKNLGGKCPSTLMDEERV